MTATITSEQAKQFKRFIEDAADQALKEAAPDKDGLQQLFSRGGEFQAYVREGVRKFATKGPVFPVYLEIEVGGKSKDDLLTELKSNGHHVSDYAKDIMGKPGWKPGEHERVKFARVKVRDLGFTKNPTTKQIWARIRELGHALCESCDGPALRLADKNQSRGDYYWIAMEQIVDSDGGPVVFSVDRDDRESWLDAGWTRPVSGWSLGSEFVFRLRK